MSIAFVRRPASSLVRCEVTHVIRKAIDLPSAFRQHQEYCRAVQDMGVTVERLPPEESFPDAACIEDNAVILPELAVVASMGTASRRGERPCLFPFCLNVVVLFTCYRRPRSKAVTYFGLEKRYTSERRHERIARESTRCVTLWNPWDTASLF